MRKLIITILVTILTLWAMPGWAQTVNKDVFYFTMTTYNGKTVFQLSGTTSEASSRQELKVPGWVAYNNNMYPTTIGASALTNLTNMQSLVIGWGCQYIHPTNLSGCSALSKIVLPSSINMQQTSFFSNAGNSSTALRIYYACLTPKSLTSYSTTYKAKSLELYLPTTRAVNIAKATNLKYVFDAIYNGAYYANDYSDTNGNGYVITQNATASADGTSTLVYAPGTDVTIQPTATFMDDYSQYMQNAYKCNAIQDSLFRNSDITRFTWTTAPAGSRIGEAAFMGCSQLTSVNTNAATINALAFYNCGNLTSLTLGTGVKTLNDMSFGTCASLSTVTLPSSLTGLNNAPFSGCSSLATINVAEGNSVYSSYDGCVYTDGTTTLTLVPIGKYYFNAAPTLQKVGDYAFDRCSQVKTVVLPYGVKEIGAYAFYYSSVERVHIPSTLTTLNTNSFSYMSNLTQLSINCDKFFNYNTTALFYCTSSPQPTDITVYVNPSQRSNYRNNWTSTDKRTITVNPNDFSAFDFSTNYAVYSNKVVPTLNFTVTSTEPATYNGRTYDGTVTIASGYVPNGTSSNARSYATRYLQTTKPVELLETVTYNNKTYLVTEIGYSAFTYEGGTLSNSSTIGLNMTLPKSLVTIGDNAFYKSCLQSVKMPPSLQVIKPYAFYGSTKLTGDIILPYGLQWMYAYPFTNTDIRKLVVPSSLKQLHQLAFTGLGAIEELYVNDTYPGSNMTLTGLNSAVKLYVPAGSEDDYRNSDWGRIVAAANITHGAYDFTSTANPYVHYSVKNTLSRTVDGVNYDGNVAIVHNPHDSEAPAALTLSATALDNALGGDKAYLLVEYGAHCFENSPITTFIDNGANKNIQAVGEYAFSGSQMAVTCNWGWTNQRNLFAIPGTTLRIGTHAFDGVSRMAGIFVEPRINGAARTVAPDLNTSTNTGFTINVQYNDPTMASYTGNASNMRHLRVYYRMLDGNASAAIHVPYAVDYAATATDNSVRYLKAYAISAYRSGTAYATQVQSAPAGTAVIVKDYGTIERPIYLTRLAQDPDWSEVGNLLWGSVAATPLDANDYTYDTTAQNFVQATTTATQPGLGYLSIGGSTPATIDVDYNGLPPFERGDIDGNGGVDIDDLNIIINIILGKTDAASYPGEADTDGSNSVDIDDMNVVINIILGKQ